VEALKYVGIYDMADRLASELNAEQQKLLDFARALAARPRYLLIDEIGAGLSVDELEGLTSKIRAALKQAVLSDISGKVMAIDGIFNVTSNGMQVGENPIPAQVFVWPNGTTTVNLLYPSEYANATAIYPEPCP
jgi:ABC-type histidine transport system ATPase subunit